MKRAAYFLFLLLISFSAKAQVQLQVPSYPVFGGTFLQNPGNALVITGGNKSSFSVDRQKPFRFLPNYALENPQGLSYLCRLELDIEKKLPLGVWIQLDQGAGLGVSPRNNAYVRFKLFNF